MAEPSTAPAKAMAVLALLSLLLASVNAASPCICSSVAEAGSAVCGSDAVSYSSACELKCAMAVNKGLTMAHKGLCKNVDSHKETNPISTNTQTGRLVSLSPLDQFGRCNIDCVDTFKKCESDCQSTDCVEQCVYNQLVDCNCGCLKLLSASQRLLSYVKDIKELPDLSFEKSLLLREGRSMQDAQQTVDCYNTEMATMLKCAEPCAPAQDEDCAIKCVRPAFERICNCKPQAAISSTSRPTAGPTRPSSQAPGPTFQTTTRPGAWTTSRPSGVTTRKPNSGSSFRSHYAVITLSFVILSVFRL